MIERYFCGAIVCLIVTAPPGTTSSVRALQAPARPPGTSSPALPERLARVRDGLFAGTTPPGDAARELKAILAADPGSAEAHLLLGIAYRAAGSPDLMGEAVAELRQALALNPGFVPAHFYLAHLYLDLGRAQRAREELETGLSQSAVNPQFLALLGEAERQLKNPARSVELNQQALKIDGSSAESRYYLALALFDLGRRADAVEELERVVAAHPNVADPYLSLGTTYVEAGRFDDAIKVLQQGLGLDASQPELRIQLARAYRSKGLLDSAEAQLARAKGTGTTALASSLYRHQQVEFDLYQEQGLLKLQRGQLEAAAAAFRKVLQMDPSHGVTNRNLAEVYLRQGQYARAAEHAARAEQAGAPLPEASRKLLLEKLSKKDGGGGK
jgi:tetratricopeptide (TPR) repeat protein